MNTSRDIEDAFKLPLDADAIQSLLPHRYPFLLVDRVIAYTPGERLTAIKNVSVNEPFFQGHFPGHPVMPGVLLIESMAQACGLLVHLSIANGENRRALFYLAKVDKARFSRMVVPGDQVTLEIEQLRQIRSMCQFRCRALVDTQVVAEAELLCAGRAG
ncbi:MAG: 3-hydroxyacyl-ACP dehydratase FabZ [Rhodanobacteraceae bacterium]